MSRLKAGAEAGALAATAAVARPGGDARHISSLDGLRATSFLLVFVSHAGLPDSVPGGFGVTVFFFLSGFLITTLMRTEYDRSGTVSLKHFWLRRALRILPPFYIVLATAIAISAVNVPGNLSAAAMAAQIFHATNYWIIYRGYQGMPVHGGTGVYWSLAVEEHFYLFFPWIYIAMRRAHLSGRRQALVLWGLCLVVLLWRVVLVMLLHAPTERTYMATDTRIDSILFGCALATWHNPAVEKWRGDERLWRYLVVPVAALVLVFTFVYRSDMFRETARYSIQGLALTPLFVAMIRFPGWWPFRLLNMQPLTFIGLLSYSLYLMHVGVLIYVQDHWSADGPVTQGFIALGLCTALASVMYICVEKPCARLRRRLSE